MDFRRLNNADMLEAKALWKTAFGDSDAFIDLYFEHKVYPGDSIGLYEDGVLASVLHLVPYTINFRGKDVRAPYIAGAATLPEYRYRGQMAALLKETLRFLSGNGIAGTHLYPFLHAFYEKYGWAVYTDMGYKTVQAEALKPQQGYALLETPDIPGMLRLYREYMTGKSGYVVRNERDFAYILQEYAQEAVKTAFAYRGGELAAYMLYEVTEGRAKAAEFVFDSEEAKNALLYGVALRDNSSSIRFPLPAKNSVTDEILPYGMMRIADAALFLKQLPIRDAEFTIALHDGFAEWNNGVYKAVYNNGVANAARTEEKPQLEMDITAFAKLAQGYRSIRELVQNKEAQVYDERDVPFLDTLFPIQETFIFEAY